MYSQFSRLVALAARSIGPDATRRRAGVHGHYGRRSARFYAFEVRVAPAWSVFSVERDAARSAGGVGASSLDFRACLRRAGVSFPCPWGC